MAARLMGLCQHSLAAADSEAGHTGSMHDRSQAELPTKYRTSMTSTVKPSLASEMAHAAPAGPAPTTTAILTPPGRSMLPFVAS